MNFIATIGLSLTPLLLSTQAQATSVAVPIASVPPASHTSSTRRGLTPDAVLRLKGIVNERLAQLFSGRDKLGKAIQRLQDSFERGEEVIISTALLNAFSTAIATGESTLEIAKESFSNILGAERVACRPALEVLRNETIDGLEATIETMKKVPELAKQIENRDAVTVVFDQERMAAALSSEKIVMKPGMSREEKRRFILSHAS